MTKNNRIQERQVSLQSVSDWPQMRQIKDFFRSDSCRFWLGEPKCIEIWSEIVPDLWAKMYWNLIWKSTVFVSFGENMTHVGPTYGDPAWVLVKCWNTGWCFVNIHIVYDQFVPSLYRNQPKRFFVNNGFNWKWVPNVWDFHFFRTKKLLKTMLNVVNTFAKTMSHENAPLLNCSPYLQTKSRIIWNT